MATAVELTIEIGKALMRNARASATEWDYAGYMFETKDGASSSGEMFLFAEKTRLPFRLGRDMKAITTDSNTCVK